MSPQNGMTLLQYSQQHQPQQFSQAQPLQNQATNPFRQSSMPNTTGQAANSFTGFQANPRVHSAGNPFARTDATQDSFDQAFSSPPPMPSTQDFSFGQQSQSPQQMAPQRTGTNPFARSPHPNAPQQPSASNSSPFGTVTSQATGSTNPFRQSAFVNQQTGQGWQASSQNTMGGLENLETIPVFPRPGQSQQTQQSPWQ